MNYKINEGELTMVAMVIFNCKHCGDKITEQVSTDGEWTVNVVCDNESCGANYVIKLEVEEA